jgi:hypothetical protein
VKAGGGVSKEHEYETKVDLSIISARWRYLPPISANDLLLRLLKALITRELEELFIDFSSKTAKIIVKKINQFLTVCKGHGRILRGLGGLAPKKFRHHENCDCTNI